MSCHSGPYNRGIVTNGLVLYYDVNEPVCYSSGRTDIQDLSRNGNTGTLVNGVGYSGDNGGSLVFDGVNDYVELSSNPHFNWGLGNWSIDMSFFTPSIYLNNNLYATYFQSGDQLSIRQLRSGLGRGIYTGGYSGAGFITSPYAVNIYSYGTFTYESPGKWSFVSLVKDGATTYFYLNGSLYASKLYNYLNQNNSILIGNNSTYDLPLNGNVPLLKTYNRALSAAEIQQNFNAHRSRFGL